MAFNTALKTILYKKFFEMANSLNLIENTADMRAIIPISLYPFDYFRMRRWPNWNDQPYVTNPEMSFLIRVE